MKLKRIYSNKPKIFSEVTFNEGLNVILGEIRQPENLDADTHNLGKTTLSQLIDFCLLKRKDTQFFLFKNIELFHEYIFYIEILSHDGKYITIRRSVKEGSKASFHVDNKKGFSPKDDDQEQWDHWSVPFERSKKLLDSYINLSAVTPWTFRNAIAYSLRTQRDYDDPFKLAKYGGRHADWKPYLSHILGLDSNLVSKTYEIENKISLLEAQEKYMSKEMREADNLDQLRGLLDIRGAETTSLQARLDNYNFQVADSDINKELVENLDREIAELNERRYHLSSTISRIQESLEQQVTFNFEDIKTVFEQSKLYFGDQIVKDYTAVENFNRKITEEREVYLKQELKELESHIGHVNNKLITLNQKRSAALVTLRDKEVFSKYRKLNRDLVKKRADLEVLTKQFKTAEKLSKIKREISLLKDEQRKVEEQTMESLESPSDHYSLIRTFVNDIISRVIQHNANLYTYLNNEVHLEFCLSIVDEDGRASGATEGYTYSRLLCIAFDMAVMRAFAHKAYPHFIYHDGIFESLDNRKKIKLIEVIKEYASTGIQHIITLIDTELPKMENGNIFSFEENEIILKLHDEGNEGRLFNMPPW